MFYTSNNPLNRLQILGSVSNFNKIFLKKENTWWEDHEVCAWVWFMYMQFQVSFIWQIFTKLIMNLMPFDKTQES